MVDYDKCEKCGSDNFEIDENNGFFWCWCKDCHYEWVE